jgi:hypothetical protein
VNPPSTQSSDLKFEIGHVLFIDIVGYSKLLITEQSNQIQTLKEIVRGTEQVRLADAEGKLLRLEDGLKILAELNETARRSYVRPELFAMIYTALGDKSKAIQLLEDEYQNRDGFDLTGIKTDPRLDPLRDEPRFQRLLAKVFPENRP